MGLYREIHLKGDTRNRIPPDKTFDGRSLAPHIGWWADRIEAAAAKNPPARYFAVLMTGNQGRDIFIDG